MNIVSGVFDALLNVLVTLSDRVLPMVLPVTAGIVLLFAGAFLARWARYAVEQLLEAATLDRLSEKVGMSALVHRLGVGRSPTRVAGFVAHTFVLVAFVVAAADVAGLPVVREYLGAVMGFMPSLIAAVIVMGAGLLLARFLGGIAQGAAMANQVVEHDFVGRACYWTVAVFSGAMALGRLGLDVTSVFSVYPHLLVASFALAGAVAVGLSFKAGRAGLDRGTRSLHVAKK